MEALILVTAPVLVLLAVAIHACAPEGTKTYSMTALGWMLLVAGFTMTVHLVQLTVVCDGLLIAGAMCLVVVIGPAVNHIALRQTGIIGYAIVWPIACIPLSKAFRQGGLPSGAIVPALGSDAEHASPSTDRESLRCAS